MICPLFRGYGRNPGRDFVGYLEEVLTPKGHFEINWPLKENQGSYDYGIALSLKGRLLYYEPIDDDIPNNDLSNMELEEVLNLKKQLVDVQPIDVHYLSIATTFIQLGRYLWLLQIRLMFSKRPKRLRENNHTFLLSKTCGIL